MNELEALEKIVKEYPIDDNLIFTNNLEGLCKILFRIRDIATQALAPQECDVEKCEFWQEGHCDCYSDESHYPHCLEYPNCYYKQLHSQEKNDDQSIILNVDDFNQLVESCQNPQLNKKLQEALKRPLKFKDCIKQRTFTLEEIDQLTQKLEKAREALKAIQKAHSETVPRIMEYAQQTLKELE